MLSFWMRFLKGETETHLQTNPALHTWVFRYTSWSKAGRHVHQSLFHCVAPIKQPSSWRKKVGCCDRFVRQLCWFKGSIEAFGFLSFLRFDNQTLFVHSVAIYISYIQYCLYEDGGWGGGVQDYVVDMLPPLAALLSVVWKLHWQHERVGGQSLLIGETRTHEQWLTHTLTGCVLKYKIDRTVLNVIKGELLQFWGQFQFLFWDVWQHSTEKHTRGSAVQHL